MVVLDRWLEIAIALLRVAVGVIFLWAGLEKLMAPEPFDAAGFLQFGTTGTLGWPFVTGTPAEGTVYNPTHDFWVGLSENDSAMRVINLLVPFGQVGIGVSLILGLFTRFGSFRHAGSRCGPWSRGPIRYPPNTSIHSMTG
jgi:thiosulfate dehydrogenase [quinone] large subunit